MYLWHCDRAGNYSLYSAGATNQNYLRGVQATDANGTVSFTSIYPGVLLGTVAAHPLRGLPEPERGDVGVEQESRRRRSRCRRRRPISCTQRRAIEQSITNLARITLATDMVFSDGASLELATITGDVAGGMTASLTVAV